MHPSTGRAGRRRAAAPDEGAAAAGAGRRSRRPSTHAVQPFSQTMWAHAPDHSVTCMGTPGSIVATGGWEASAVAHAPKPPTGLSWVGTNVNAGRCR